MKNLVYIPIFICVLFSFLYTGCEKAELQKSTPNDTVQVEPRGDCEECPGGDECCCLVSLQPTGSAVTLAFCGTSNGGSVCIGAATGTCSSFSGGGQTLNLAPNDPRQPFCMDMSAPFYIQNTSISNTALIIITCQAELTAPDTIWLQIPPGEFRFIQTNGSCVVGPC